MKPTDEIDDLLTRAGARWRADQEAPPEPDLEYMLSGGRKPRRWVPALAAASVAVVAAGIIAVLPNHQDQPQGPPQSIAQGNHQPNDEQLVKPGDKVQVSGRIVAVPGKMPVFCLPLP